MKDLIRQFKNFSWEKKVLWSAAALSLIPVLAALLLQGPSAPAGPANTTRAEVDTYIPKGFVLVPIEVQNYEALDSILGHFGVVDLFQAGQTGHPEQRLVARNVRILRAPQNPSHFAVLVQEGEVAHVLKFGGQFTVIVKRPEKVGTEFVKDPVITRRTIVYEGE
jgi:hypothetical protein